MKKIMFGLLMSIAFLSFGFMAHAQDCLMIKLNAQKAELGWDANVEPDIAGYRVFERQDPAGEWIGIADVPHPETSFVILKTEAGTWYFGVLAFDTDGLPSEIAYLTDEGQPVCARFKMPPGKPKGLRVERRAK